MIKVTIRGKTSTIARIKQIEDAFTKDKIDRIIEQVAIDLQSWAWADCPVDTGLLRGSITVSKVQNGYRVYVDEVYYGVWVHDGTRWMPPRPFLLGRNAKKAKIELRNKLKLYIEKVVK